MHRNQPTSTGRIGNLLIPAEEWKMFPIPTEELLPSLLGNILVKIFPIPTGKLFWELFPILTGKHFPSLLGKVPNLSWERFPILTGKHFPYSGEPFSPSWLGKICPSQWEIVLITSGKCFLILQGNVWHFHYLPWQFCQFFEIRVKTAWILQRINSSRNGSKRETFPRWLSTNYEKYSPLQSIASSGVQGINNNIIIIITMIIIIIMIMSLSTEFFCQFPLQVRFGSYSILIYLQ